MIVRDTKDGRKYITGDEMRRAVILALNEGDRLKIEPEDTRIIDGVHRNRYIYTVEQFYPNYVRFLDFAGMPVCFLYADLYKLLIESGGVFK